MARKSASVMDMKPQRSTSKGDEVKELETPTQISTNHFEKFDFGTGPPSKFRHRRHLTHLPTSIYQPNFATPQRSSPLGFSILNKLFPSHHNSPQVDNDSKRSNIRIPFELDDNTLTSDLSPLGPILSNKSRFSSIDFSHLQSAIKQKRESEKKLEGQGLVIRCFTKQSDEPTSIRNNNNLLDISDGPIEETYKMSSIGDLSKDTTRIAKIRSDSLPLLKISKKHNTVKLKKQQLDSLSSTKLKDKIRSRSEILQPITPQNKVFRPEIRKPFTIVKLKL